MSGTESFLAPTSKEKKSTPIGSGGHGMTYSEPADTFRIKEVSEKGGECSDGCVDMHCDRDAMCELLIIPFELDTI